MRHDDGWHEAGQGMAGMDLNDIAYDAYLANDRTLGDPPRVTIFRPNDEDAMSNRLFSRTGPLSLVAVGVGLTAALVAIYVACAVVALVAPGRQLSHAWLGLFSATPLSTLGLVEGVLSNGAFALLAAAAFMPTYNKAVDRAA